MKRSIKAVTCHMLLCAAACVNAAPAFQYPVRDDGRIPEVMLIDMDGDGIRLSSPAEGVVFVFGQGQRARSAWPINGAGDGFVAIDQNRDGRISFIGELVGGVLGPPNGFDYLRRAGLVPSLAERDRLDRSDPLFRRLLVWTDSDRDGMSAETELQSLEYAGFSGIDLANVELINPGKPLAGGSVATAIGTATQSSAKAAAQLMTVRLSVENNDARVK